MKKLLSIGLLILSIGAMGCESIKTVEIETTKTTNRFNKLIEKVQQSENEEMVRDIRDQMEMLKEKRLLELDHISKTHLREDGAFDLYLKLVDEENNFFKYINTLDKVIENKLGGK